MKGLSTKSGFASELDSGLLLCFFAIPLASAQMQIGDNTKMKAGGMFTAGYQGDYGNSAQIESDHGLGLWIQRQYFRFLLQSQFSFLQRIPLLQSIARRFELPIADRRQRRHGHGQSLYRQPLSRVNHLSRRPQQHRNLRAGGPTQLHYSWQRRGFRYRLERVASRLAHPVGRLTPQGSGSGTVYGTTRAKRFRHQTFQCAVFLSRSQVFT